MLLAQRKGKLQAAREALAARAATATPESHPRTNLTDPDSRLMPQANDTYIQGYNAQLAVENQGLVVGQQVCQSTSDITALKDTACTVEAQPGQIEHIVVDQGYDRQAQIDATEEALEVTVVGEPTRIQQILPATPSHLLQLVLLTPKSDSLQRGRLHQSPSPHTTTVILESL